MAPPVKKAPPVKIGFSGGWEPGVTTTSPKYSIPSTIAGSKMAERGVNDSAKQDISPTPYSLSLHFSKQGLADDIGLCSNELCKKLDIGVTGGYQFGGIGAWKMALFAEHDFSTDSLIKDSSVVIHAQIEGKILSGREYSYSALDTVDLFGFNKSAALMVGPRFKLGSVPISCKAGVVVNSGADLAPGFHSDGGMAFMATCGVDDVVAPAAKLAGYEMNTTLSKTDDCQDAAAGLQLGPNTLSAAVAKCKDSALPVFEAMAKRITEFKVVIGDPANLKEYGLYLKQFSEGIASAVAASKLTDADAVGMMKQLAKFHRPLLAELFIDPTRHEQALEAGLTALHYPILPLLKIDPADAAIKKSADEVLSLILESAQHEGKAFLPNVLNQLITIGKDSAWLKSHKHDLLDAAKTLPRGADRTAIELSLQTTFK